MDIPHFVDPNNLACFYFFIIINNFMNFGIQVFFSNMYYLFVCFGSLLHPAGSSLHRADLSLQYEDSLVAVCGLQSTWASVVVAHRLGSYSTWA